MKTPAEPLRFLSWEEMETLHRSALRILAEVGMTVDHHGALDYLAGAGCRVDRDRKHVLFPEEVVNGCVERMRRDFRTRQHPERMAVRYSHVRFRQEKHRIHPDFTVSAGGFCCFIYDLEGVRRPATIEDTRDALRLAAQLDQIAYTGIPVAAQEVPLKMRPVRMAAELVKTTGKLGGIEAFTPFDIEYICRIGEVVRGGREAHRRDPILVGYAEARTPLCLDGNMAQVLIEYVRRGLPQSLDTMPNAGATAPMHPAGTLALGLAETLSGLVLAYAVDPAAVVTIDITPSFMDMRTGIYKYAGPERASLLGSRVQLISEFYGCPSGIHGGKTDACAPDVRCGAEKAMSMLYPVLCGSVGFGTVGHLENALTFSPQQLVMDNEIARCVRRSIGGFEVTDETVDLDLIRRVGIGGNYLQEDETAEQFRDYMSESAFLGVAPWGSSAGIDAARSWPEMARERARELLRKELEPPLSPEQAQAVDEIVAEAESAAARA